MVTRWHGEFSWVNNFSVSVSSYCVHILIFWDYTTVKHKSIFCYGYMNLWYFPHRCIKHWHTFNGIFVNVRTINKRVMLHFQVDVMVTTAAFAVGQADQRQRPHLITMWTTWYKRLCSVQNAVSSLQTLMHVCVSCESFRPYMNVEKDFKHYTKPQKLISWAHLRFYLGWWPLTDMKCKISRDNSCILGMSCDTSAFHIVPQTHCLSSLASIITTFNSIIGPPQNNNRINLQS